MATDKAGRWIKVRSGFGEFEMSQLGPDEKVMASGLHDGGWSVMRNAAERVAAPPEPAREPHDGWLNTWAHENVKEFPVTFFEYLWHNKIRKMAGDWADFRVAALQAKVSTLEKALRTAQTDLIELAGKLVRRELLPSLETCKTIRQARIHVQRFDQQHVAAGMKLKEIAEKLRLSGESRQ